MVARVGTLAVGAQFDTLLTGRRGVVRVHESAFTDGLGSVELGATVVQFLDQPAERRVKALHPDVRVRVVEVTH